MDERRLGQKLGGDGSLLQGRLFPSDKDSEQVSFRQLDPLLHLKQDVINKMKTIKFVRVETWVSYRFMCQVLWKPLCTSSDIFTEALYYLTYFTFEDITTQRN